MVVTHHRLEAFEIDLEDVMAISLGWKEHFVKQGDGHGGWEVRPAEYQILQHPDGLWTPPFGLALMDNGELILMGMHQAPDKTERIVYTFSADMGESWSEFHTIPDSEAGRPMMLANLGGGRLTFVSEQRYFSDDYGRSWPQRIQHNIAHGMEGNSHVEMGRDGMACRMAIIGTTAESLKEWPHGAGETHFNWSDDSGRTYRDDVAPPEWYWDDVHDGKTYRRGVSEGSVTRAANGWLIAALRTDMPARYFAPYLETPGEKEGVYYDDSLEGTAVSISEDDGRTWSPLNILFDAGRHHAHLLRTESGEIVMTVTVRADVRDGVLASYRRGCDALVSKDNGLTWNLDQRIVLDEYGYYNSEKWFNGECGHLYSLLLPDGQILTAHANYPMKGMSLIRWSL